MRRNNARLLFTEVQGQEAEGIPLRFESSEEDGERGFDPLLKLSKTHVIIYMPLQIICRILDSITYRMVAYDTRYQITLYQILYNTR